VIPRQLPALHAAPIVHDRQRRVSWVGEKADARRAGVERVRHGFGENCLFKGTGVRIPQIFEQVLEVDSGFAQACMSSPAAAPSSLWRARIPARCRNVPSSPGRITPNLDSGVTGGRQGRRERLWSEMYY
jgi:hypothetical protein